MGSARLAAGVGATADAVVVATAARAATDITPASVLESLGGSRRHDARRSRDGDHREDAQGNLQYHKPPLCWMLSSWFAAPVAANDSSYFFRFPFPSSS